MAKLKMCKYCKENKSGEAYFSTLDDDVYICPNCNHELIDTIMGEEDHWVLFNISTDVSFLEAMIKLKEDDIIEYESRMSQFRAQVQQKEQAEQQSKPHCPHCNSTNIKSLSGVNRGVSIAMWGIFSKKINKSFECLDCKYTW